MKETHKYVTPEVNLLPEDDLEQRPGGKFLKWSLSWGKKIVVLTELIVVVAFLSRFKLDSDVATLSEEIDRRKTIILASQNFENDFRRLQEKVKKVKVTNSLPSLVNIYDTVQLLIPQAVAINEISITDTHVGLEGKGDDQNLSSMVTAFKSSPNFTDVTLNKVTKQGQEAEIEFSLSADYVNK